MKTAIIGGTGLYSAGDGRQIIQETEYGKAHLDVIDIDGMEVAFLARHGRGHIVPPHRINYRANMKALYDLGVRHVYASVAVGSMNPSYKPGDLVVLSDFLDFTKVREQTYFTGGEAGVRHVDMTDPYCKNLRQLFFDKAAELGVPIAGSGVYVTTEGPRFETAAEIRFMRLIGGDVVGMTNVPEAVLAKELGICYSAVGIVTNWCTGMTEDISGHEIDQLVGGRKDELTRLFIEVFKMHPDQSNCQCNASLI